MTWSKELCLESSVEKPFFFGKAGRKKYAVFHEPAKEIATGVPLLICHPHFEEKLRSHRILVDLARKAALRGHPVLRFDFSGQGDSEGEVEDFDFAAMESDVDEAFFLLRDRTGCDPVILGLRIGGALAGRAAARHRTATVLWQPVVDPKTWIMEVLRANMTFQLRQEGKVTRKREDLIRDLETGRSVQLEGYGLTSAFYSTLMQSGGLTGQDFPGKCKALLEISIRKAVTGASSPLEKLMSQRDTTLAAVHVQEKDEAFWLPCKRYRIVSGNLEQTTLDWIGGLRAKS